MQRRIISWTIGSLLKSSKISPSQPRFHSCQKGNLTLPWLKSVWKLVRVFYWMMKCISSDLTLRSISRNLCVCVSIFPLKPCVSCCTEEGLLFSGTKVTWCLFLYLSEPVSALSDGMKANATNYKIKEL